MAIHRISAIDDVPFADLLSEDRFGDPSWTRLPVIEKVSDRLCDLLLTADEILHLLSGHDAGEVRHLETKIRGIYDEIDALMRNVSD